LGDGVIGGLRVVLTAQAGIGDSKTAIQINMPGIQSASLYAVTSTGNINIASQGDLAIDQVQALSGGNVTLSAPGSIIVATTYEGLVTGGIVNLTAIGGVGNSTSTPLVLLSGQEIKDSVSINADGNVYVQEKTGNLRLHNLTTTGSVWIDVIAGNLIDANNTQIQDDRTRTALLGGVWADLGLTAGTGASQKILDTISSFKSAKQQEYISYWNYRNTQANPAVFDSSFIVNLSSVEDAYYRNTLAYDQAAIDTLVSKRTQEYHDLNARYGVGSQYALDNSSTYHADIFNATFSYTLTIKEDSDLRGSIKVWTEEELLYSMSSGMLKATADTQVNNEDPNIVGTNITIKTAQAIGNMANKIVVDVSTKPIHLTVDQQIAFAVAERADLTYVGGKILSDTFDFVHGDTDTIIRHDNGNWISDGFVVGMHVQVEGTSANTTAKAVFYEVASVNSSTLTLTVGSHLSQTEYNMLAVLTPIVIDPTLASQKALISAITIDQRNNVNLESTGTLNIVAGTSIDIGTQDSPSHW